ncbi:PLC-D group protein Nfis6, partial [Rasamsonia emersonii CBS 393.64]
SLLNPMREEWPADLWTKQYAEHPGPTNTNRQFATAGTTCGFVDNTNQAAGWFNNVTGVSCATSIFEWGGGGLGGSASGACSPPKRFCSLEIGW